LWPWFLGGFSIVFLGMAVAWPMHFYNGESIRQTVLGHYYLLEFQLQLNASGNLGPTSGNLSVALATAATHLVIAAVAGAMAMGVGWHLQRRAR
jgi:hypothetical protein